MNISLAQKHETIDQLWQVAELTRSYMIEIGRAPNNRDQARIDAITAELVPMVLNLPWEDHLIDLARSGSERA